MSLFVSLSQKRCENWEIPIQKTVNIWFRLIELKNFIIQNYFAEISALVDDGWMFGKKKVLCGTLVIVNYCCYEFHLYLIHGSCGSPLFVVSGFI